MCQRSVISINRGLKVQPHLYHIDLAKLITYRHTLTSGRPPQIINNLRSFSLIDTTDI